MKFQAKKLTPYNSQANSQTKNPYSAVLLGWVNTFWLPGAHQNSISSTSSAGVGEEIGWIQLWLVAGTGWWFTYNHYHGQNTFSLGKYFSIQSFMTFCKFFASPAWVFSTESSPPGRTCSSVGPPHRSPTTLLQLGLLSRGHSSCQDLAPGSSPWHSGHIHVLHIYKFPCSTFWYSESNLKS